MPGRPLEGIRVIELAEHGFVPAGAAALADWGADVVKLEKPSGDALRAIAAQGLVPKAGEFEYLVEIANRNKRGLGLDLRVPEGRALLDRLVAGADVFITNQLPKVLRKYRIEPKDLLAVNPRLVYARGHGQGQRGPESEVGGFDGVSFFARAGIAHMLTPEGASQVVGSRPAFGDFPSGAQLAGGIAAALVKVLRTGEGVTVDLSLLASGIWQLAPDLAYASYTGHAPPKVGSAPATSSPLVGTYRTRDGRFLGLVMIEEARYWPLLCRALDHEEWTGDARFATPEERAANRDALHALIVETFTSGSLAHWEERLLAEGCVFSKYASPEEVLRDPQVELNGYLPAHPTIAGARVPATPQQFDDQPVELRRPAPRLGEHSDELLRELGLADTEVAALRACGAVV